MRLLRWRGGRVTELANNSKRYEGLVLKAFDYEDVKRKLEREYRLNPFYVHICKITEVHTVDPETRGMATRGVATKSV